MTTMLRTALAIAFLLATVRAALAEEPFEPSGQERQQVDACLERNAGEDELKLMSDCIGIIAKACIDAPDATTVSLVACHMREQKIWDARLNAWYADAKGRLEGESATALQSAQRDWIAFRDAKCGYWQKRYAGGTFASVAAGDCMRVETGRRAIEMRTILDDLDH